MSDTIDPRLLGKMVARLQSTVEDVRQEYAGIRASLDSLSSNVLSRNAEFNVRLSSLELAQMRLAASVDSAHTKIDRIERDTESLKEQQEAMVRRLDGMDNRLDGMASGLDGMAGRLDGMASRQDSMDAKLDLILARLEAR